MSRLLSIAGNLLGLGCFIVCAWGLRHVVVDDDPRDLYRLDGQMQAALDRFQANFGPDDNDCILVVRAPNLFSPQAIPPFKRLIVKVQQMAGIESVASLADVTAFKFGVLPQSVLPSDDTTDAALFEQAREEALKHPMVDGQLLSPDGNTALILARLDKALRTTPRISVKVAELEKAVADVTAGTPLKVQITGVPAIRSHVFAAAGKSVPRQVAIATLISALAGMLFLRRPRPLALAGFMGVMTAVWTVGGLSAANAWGLLDFRLGIFSLSLGVMVLAPPLASGLHLTRVLMRDAKAPADTPRQFGRAFRAVRCGALAVAICSCIGWVPLLFEPASALHSLVLGLIVGAWIHPLLLQCMYVRTARLMLRGLVPSEDHFWKSLFAEVPRAPGRRAAAFAGGQSFAPWMHLAAFGVLFAGWAYVWQQSPLPAASSLSETLDTRDTAYQTFAYCDQTFGGALVAPVTVVWPEGAPWPSETTLQVLEEVEAALKADSRFAYPLSMLQLLDALPGIGRDRLRKAAGLRLTPQAIKSRYVNEEARTLVISAHIKDAEFREHLELFRSLESRLAEIAARHPGYSLQVTGTPVFGPRSIAAMIAKIRRALTLGCLALGLACVLVLWRTGVWTASWACAALLLLPFVVTGLTIWKLDLPLQVTTTGVFVLGFLLLGHVLFTLLYANAKGGTAPTYTILNMSSQTPKEVGFASSLGITVVMFAVAFSITGLSGFPPVRLFSIVAMACLLTIAACAYWVERATLR